MWVVDRVVALLGLSPFAYMVIAVFGLIVWTWCSAIGDFALTGRGIWLRRSGLVITGVGAALFAYTAYGLK